MHSHRVLKNLLRNTFGFVVFILGLGMESSQPIAITDLVTRRKKKRRTRATDSFTGKFSGNEPSGRLQELVLILKMCTFLFYGLPSIFSLCSLYRASSSDLSKCLIAYPPDIS